MKIHRVFTAAFILANTFSIEAARPFDFGRDIGGILTRKGCNGASCHGGVKGRGGFKLSAGALYPKEDYEWIVKGGEYQVLTSEVKGPRVPRIDLTAPEKSLMLQKATGATAHGGGRSFDANSPEYRTLLAWIRNGAPFGADSSREARILRLDVSPRLFRWSASGASDCESPPISPTDAAEDFTDQALYTSNDKDIASVDEDGMVRAERLGETAILVRAAGAVASATVGVIGPEITNYPAVPKFNFIDEFIFDKLRQFRIVPSELSSDSEFLRASVSTSPARCRRPIACGSFCQAGIRRSARSSSMR